MCCYTNLFAQTQQSIKLNVTDLPVATILDQITELAGVPIIYATAQLPQGRYDIEADGTVDEILAILHESTGLQYRSGQSGFIVTTITGREEQTILIRGVVRDAATREPLVGAHIWNESTGVGTSTNAEGQFNIAIHRENHSLKVSYLGYLPVELSVASRSARFEIDLVPSVRLDEVVIYSDDGLNEMNPGGDASSIMPTDDPRMLGIGGVFDLQKAATTIPGVNTGTDGVGGLSVRGGSYDQNLVLLDGVQLYSPSHAIGIVSAINPLTLSRASVYKGAYSARFSGRLSSVMDVATRGGNADEWNLTASVGPLSIEGIVEGPIVPGKISFLVAGRAFVPTAYLKGIAEREKQQQGLEGSTAYRFFDFNAALSVKLTDKDNIDLRVYGSSDEYNDVTEKMIMYPDSRYFQQFDKRLNWGNQSVALNWSRQVGHSGYSKLSLAYSKFELQSLDLRGYSEVSFNPRATARGFDNLEFKTYIRDFSLKWDAIFTPHESIDLMFGAAATHHTLRPKGVAFTDALRIEQFVIDESTLDDALFSDLEQQAVEAGAYSEVNWQIGSKWRARAGLHLSAFAGKDKTYFNPQPRLQLAYRASDLVSFELNAGTTVQYLHLITSNGIGLPTDLWVPSTDRVKPQLAHQYSLSSSWKLPVQMTLGWSLFYKQMRNLTLFEQGASFLLDEGTVQSGIIDATDWEKKVIQGDGHSYGSEWSLTVPLSKGSYLVNYTLARSERQFDDINNGMPFDYKFDRRHNLNTSLSWRFNSVFQASAAWYFGSGTPVTLAEGRYLYQDGGRGLAPVNLQIIEYGERNAFRLPAYHRLDLAASATWKRPRAEHTVSLNLYNVYNRQNVLYVAFVEDDQTGEFTFQKYTVFPFIPSISYKISL